MAKIVWKANRVIGTLKLHDQEVRVQFKVHCDVTGRLVFTFSKIPFNQSTRWLMHHFTSKGRYIEFLKLDGEDSAGQRISTDYFIMTGYNSSNNTRSSFFTPKGSTKWLQVRPKSSFDRSASMTVTVRYDIVGIQGFGQQNAMSELGNIRLGAASRVDNYDELTGYLDIEVASVPERGPEWIKMCDKKIDMILEILSIAQDMRVDWSIRRVYEGKYLTSILFVGPHSTARPQHPIFSHLHLQPALNLAVNSYTDYLRDVLGMGFALEYFLMRPHFVELQFVSAMTGLEHMLQRFSSRGNKCVIIPKRVFKDVLLTTMGNALTTEIRRLNSANGEEIIISPEASDLLQKKLTGINELTLRDKLFNFLRHHKVPLHLIAEEQIANLVRTRNILAHARKYKKTPQAERLNDDLAVLHELMKRIFLTLLDYRGKRNSFLNGEEWVDFPPSEK